MLRILRYSPSATTNIVQKEHNQAIHIAQSGTVWFIDFSVTDALQPSVHVKMRTSKVELI